MGETTEMEKLNEYLKANRGQAIRLAAYLGLRPSTISQWKSVPVEHVAEVEKFTGIDRRHLIPDAFREAKDAD